MNFRRLMVLPPQQPGVSQQETFSSDWERSDL
jgi:hypothetical protein